MGKVAAATIVTKTYLSFARVLADSLRRHHPDMPLFALLTDEVDGHFSPEAESFILLHLDGLFIPRSTAFRFRYSWQQVVTATKPYLLSHLLDRSFDSAVFLDADILITGNLERLLEPVSQHAVVLSPHLLAPLEDRGRVARELNILQSGAFNGGFLGVSDRPQARAFLEWWQDRLYGHCDHAIADGMLYDQRWLDLAPVFFEDVHVLRDPGCNVAYWNLPERVVRTDGDEITVDGEPCRLMHFSGFDPGRPETVTRHSSRLEMATIGSAAQVFRRYAGLLEAAGYRETKNWPYAYGCFDNGVTIPDVARQIYRNLKDAGRFGDPFRASCLGSFYDWLNESAVGHDEPSASGFARSSESGALKGAITRLWQAVYDRRPDVRQAFPDLHGADRAAFLGWAATQGMKEHGIPEELLPGVE